MEHAVYRAWWQPRIMEIETEKIRFWFLCQCHCSIKVPNCRITLKRSPPCVGHTDLWKWSNISFSLLKVALPFFSAANWIHSIKVLMQWKVWSSVCVRKLEVLGYLRNNQDIEARVKKHLTFCTIPWHCVPLLVSPRRWPKEAEKWWSTNWSI